MWDKCREDSVAEPENWSYKMNSDQIKIVQCWDNMQLSVIIQAEFEAEPSFSISSREESIERLIRN